MKILIAATNSEMFSGATRCLLELAKGLTDKNQNVVVLLPREGDVEPQLKLFGIRYFIVHEYHSWYTSKNHRKNKFKLKRFLNDIAVCQVKKLIKAEHIDIVHVNALTGYVAGKAAIELNIPVVWHIREFMEEDLNISFYDREYSLKLLNRATKFVAISQPIYDKWSGILKAPVEIVHDGVPVEAYYVSHKKAHSTVNILLYGRIVPGKGQLFYIKGAIEALKRINVPCHFCFAGKIEDESYYQECMNEIRKYNCENAVEYIGEISNIKDLLSRSDIVCVCSKMEGFGRVTVESMLGQCLVIGADTGATREIIRDKRNGLLYREGNIEDFVRKLEDAINCYDKYDECRINGQAYAVSTFTVENNVSEILKIYRRLVSNENG